MHRILTFGSGANQLAKALDKGRFTHVSMDHLGSETEAILDLYEAFDGRPPDLMVVDVSRHFDGLPIRHIKKVAREIWGQDVPMPPCLALVSPRQLTLHELPTLAEDFVLPPFQVEEVIARLNFLMFRYRRVATSNLMRYADLELDLDRMVALNQNGCRLPLTPKEFALLAFLCSHQGKFFSREVLLGVVWGVHFAGSERTVDIHVRRIRAKLPPKAATFLETRRGVGYGLRPSRDT